MYHTNFKEIKYSLAALMLEGVYHDIPELWKLYEDILIKLEYMEQEFVHSTRAD